MHQVSGFYLYRGTLWILSKYLVDFASVGISELGSVFRNLQPLILQCIFKKFIKLTVVWLKFEISTQKRAGRYRVLKKKEFSITREGNWLNFWIPTRFRQFLKSKYVFKLLSSAPFSTAILYMFMHEYLVNNLLSLWFSCFNYVSFPHFQYTRLTRKSWRVYSTCWKRSSYSVQRSFHRDGSATV